MAIITVEDLTGSVEVVVYPRPYIQCRLALRIDEVVVVKGKTRENGEETKIIGDDISTLDSHLEGELHLKIKNADSILLDQVQIMIRSFRGNSPVFLHFEKEKKVIKAGEEYHVDLSGLVVGRLEDLLGKSMVKVKRKNNEIRAGLGKENIEKEEELVAAVIAADKKADLSKPAKKALDFFSILEL